MASYDRDRTRRTTIEVRRQAMRHFGPPHTPDLIPSMEAGIQRLCNELLDKAKGKTRIDLVDDYAYPVPVMVICKILGVPLKDEPKFHAWIFDFMAGLTDLGPETDTEEGKTPQARRDTRATDALAAVLGRADRGVPQEAHRHHALEDGARRSGPDGPMSPTEAATNAAVAAARRS